QQRAHEAVSLHREALRLQARSLDPKHPERATTLELWAKSAMTIGELSDAEPLAEETLAILEERLGADHLRVADALFTLAEVRARQTRWGEARTHCRRALTVVTRVLGSRHPSIGGHLDEYSAILRSADQVCAEAMTSTTGPPV
ncbi:MAG: tetratricopeptide repeat protein, partial [Candidatus Eiseniibacteriota bacterium]